MRKSTSSSPAKRLLASLAVVSLALVSASSLSSAHEYTLGKLMIGHPWSRATAPGVKIGGGYLTVMNHGEAPDRLVKVEAPFAERAEIHESSTENGVAKMREIEGGLVVKPGETVAFAPGGKHLMFIGLKEPLTKGQKVKGALVFETAGRVEVEFAVEAAGGKPDEHKHDGDMKGMDHSGR